MYKTLLIIDDDIKLVETLAKNLQSDELKVLKAHDTKIASEIIKILKPDAIILDRMMPKVDGLTYLKELRKAEPNIPVLMLTALGDTENVISGLSIGANDYLGKPFNFNELQLRINNLLKISNKPEKSIVKEISNEFFINDFQLKLSENEKLIFKKLLINTGQPVNLLNTNLDGLNERNLPMIIKRLRTKIICATNKLEIQSIYKKGYKLIQKGIL